MSLNWSISKIKDWEKLRVWGDPDGVGGIKPYKDQSFRSESSVWRLDGTTHTLVMMTMSVGMGEITEKNKEEFFLRLSFFEKLFGPMRTKKKEGNGEWEDVYFRFEDVVRHVGLETNVAYEAHTKWIKRMWDAHRRLQMESLATHRPLESFPA